jgi:hypothetical protein
MHSHIAAVQNGRKIYLNKLGEGRCYTLHRMGTLMIGNAVISNLIPNQTLYHSVALAGTFGVDGCCSGTQHLDGYESWNSVVVQASVKIIMRSLETAAKRSFDTIILPSGTQCSRSSPEAA